MGLQGLPEPEAYGGSGVDALTTAVALEALGCGCQDSGLNHSICAYLLACVIPVWKHGSEAQKNALLPGLCDGSLIAVNAMTESDTGSDSFAMNKCWPGRAIAKLFTSEALVATTQDAVQIMGGYGFMTENNIERTLRDAVATTIYSGTSDIQRNIIARWLRL